jgi:hypothetical protein
MTSGLGSWAVASGEIVVAGVVVVNAFGDVRDGQGVERAVRLARGTGRVPGLADREASDQSP